MDYFKSILQGLGISTTATNEGGALGWFKSRDNKFKLNVVTILVVTLLFFARWLEESNGSQTHFTETAAYFMTYGLTFFGDLAVTGRLSFKTFNLQFFIMALMYFVVALIDVAIVFALVVFTQDMTTQAGQTFGPTKRGLLAAGIGFVIQQFYGNLLREHWVYKGKYFSGPTLDLVKSILVIVLAVGCVIQYIMVYHEYNEAIVRKDCVLVWDANIGKSICDVYNDPEQSDTMLMCSSFCAAGGFTAEPLCQQLIAAQDAGNCPQQTQSRNIGKDIGAALIVVVLLYMVFGGLIPKNEYTLAAVFATKPSQVDTGVKIEVPNELKPLLQPEGTEGAEGKRELEHSVSHKKHAKKAKHSMKKN